MNLPEAAADLFIQAGARVVERAVRGGASMAEIEAVLARAGAQAGRLTAGGGAC